MGQTKCGGKSWFLNGEAQREREGYACACAPVLCVAAGCGGRGIVLYRMLNLYDTLAFAVRLEVVAPRHVLGGFQLAVDNEQVFFG